MSNPITPVQVQHSALERLNQTMTILNELLQSAALDVVGEADDCLENFDSYTWQMNVGCDESKFQALLMKGNAGDMTMRELAEFLEMTSSTPHAYCWIYAAQKVAKLHDDMSARPHKHLKEYAVMAISTGHLTIHDAEELSKGAGETARMVMERDSGFFIKLYTGDYSLLNTKPEYSDSLNDIIRWAEKAGYQMIEFDEAATEVEHFPVYEW